jgi:hypothetical protein
VAFGGALHSASSDLSDVGADRPLAGMAFDKMRRPGTKRTLATLGLKNVSGSFRAHREPQPPKVFGASSPRVSVHLAIVPFLDPRTEPF